MNATLDIHAALIRRTLRVPLPEGAPGDGAAAARQLDVALLAAGFKCSPELLSRLGTLHPAEVARTGRAALQAARELAGDHVKHNAYFIDFPANVPDTEAFWAQCVGDALIDTRSQENVARQLLRGVINLLDLPRYGRYQHTYEEMRARHADLIASAKDRVTVLHLGGRLAEESARLYRQLAASAIPLHEADRSLLGALADLHAADPQPDDVPVRENRALINAAQMRHGNEPTVDTVTDVLRLACALSEGDVTLTTPTRLRSFRRAERRVLLGALDAVVSSDPTKLADVRRHDEPFKRLAERLHPHDYPRFASAADVFVVARGERTVQSVAGRVDAAIAAGDATGAIGLLRPMPSALLRATDQLARSGADPTTLAEAVGDAARSASLRVVLQLRQHLLNRDAAGTARLFVNQEGRAWATPDLRPPLPQALAGSLGQVLDDAIVARLPKSAAVVVDPVARRIALPLSDKTKPNGLGQLPRGSVTPVEHRHLRFFVYWKQRLQRTDYDLSVLLLDADYHSIGHLSYTNLSEVGAVHSGDITEAPAGASEFVDLDLETVDAAYIVPQVNIYAGDRFDEAEEAFFGFMQREPGQQGAPFEPRTVRAKSDLFGESRVMLPLVFARGTGDGWTATWMHLGLRGSPRFNRVEHNRVSTSMLARSIVERDHLTFGYLERLLHERGASVVESPIGLDAATAVTYLGLDESPALPAGSLIISPSTFWETVG